MSRPLPRAQAVAGVTVLALTLGLACAASAKEPDRTAAVVKDLEACRSIQADAERLACYDKAAGALQQAQATGAVVVLDKQQIQEAKKDAFGFSMPSFKFFDRGEKPEAMDEVVLVVERAYHNGEGKWVIKTENGQTWRQTDDYELFKPPHKGSEARIKRGLLNSFTINIDGQRSFKAHRDE